jgi:hypothetical protein
MKISEIPWLELAVLLIAIITIAFSAIYSKPYQEKLLAIFYFLMLSLISFFLLWSKRTSSKLGIAEYIFFGYFLLLVVLAITYYVLDT